MSDHDRPIIIVRRKKVAHGHHGGAWKIAFADFMTAMMAFFLVMWILASSDEKTRQSVAEYFSTPLVVAMAGGDKPTASDSAIPGGGPDPTHAEGERMRIDLREKTRSSDEQARLQDLKKRIEAVIENDPALRELREQIRLELTPEGLRIQLVDTESRPMFEVGSARVAPYLRSLLRTIAPMLNELPNSIQITGHTDSRPYPGGEVGYGNWELSSERANASRRELVAGGLSLDKLLRVAGMADRVPFEGAGPHDPMNRRIAVIVLDSRTAAAILEQSSFTPEAEPAPTPSVPPVPATGTPPTPE
ncbi:flagellar motor protein MotB [Pseudomonas oryzae]|uniref:Chemotaxis protein MotB n=1 Tax=Pseudomonas oryzae TaxID=1392877 RepID=A0A1H1NT11_9PSED|nr:flagellar motor protein MotB [Pseudomonas oryzae]SDS01509.1 chemotaxis protein MotB [Pseudomonas oryzae]